MIPARPLDQPTPARVLVLRGLDGPGGGAEHIILQTARTLDPARYRETVCCFRHIADRDFDLDRRCQALGVDYREIRHHGPWDRHVVQHLARVVDELQPQLIHSHDYKASFFAARVARSRKIPRMATCHGWTGHTWRERWIYYPADKWQLRDVAAVLGVSEDICQELARWGVPRDRLQVILNGIDPTQFRMDAAERARIRATWKFPDNAWIVGGVGRSEPQKRFDRLLDAFAQIAATDPRAALVIAGDGSRLQSLRAEVAHRQLTTRVRLLGHTSHPQEVYQGLDLLVQSSDYEGTPTVIIEAMAMRIPIVATDVGGTRQLVTSERDGLLVKPHDVAALAAAMVATRDDPHATARRVASAYERATTSLTFARRTWQLQSIYDQILAQKRSTATP